MVDEPKKQRRWFFYGCSTLIILAFLLGILGALYLLYFKKTKPANPLMQPSSAISTNPPNL